MKDPTNLNPSIKGQPLFTPDDLIDVYTRRQAIDDGVLVNLTQEWMGGMVCEAGIKWPLAATVTAFEAAIWPSENPEAERWLCERCQDAHGRLWDVLMLLKRAMLSAPAGRDTVRFLVSVIDWRPRPRGRRNVELKCVCGPGDDGAPVLTLMLPEED